MHRRTRYVCALCVPLLGLLAWSGCGTRKKSTAELLADLKSSREKDRVIAVRLLPQRTGDAAQAVPALADALKDEEERHPLERGHRAWAVGGEQCAGSDPRAAGGGSATRTPGYAKPPASPCRAST